MASVFRQVTSTLGWIDIDAAMRWCEAHCDGPFGKGMRDTIAQIRLNAGEDGTEVMNWVASASPGRNKNHALGMTYETWAIQDRRAAMRWMEERVEATPEPEPWLRILFGNYARLLAADSPAEAIAWLDKWAKEGGREEVRVRIVRKWIEEDPEAANAWLEQSALSEQARARARNARLPSYIPETPQAPAPMETAAP